MSERGILSLSIPKSLRSATLIDRCRYEGLVAARAGTEFAIFELDHPHVVVPYNIVSSIRHDPLHENLGRTRQLRQIISALVLLSFVLCHLVSHIFLIVSPPLAEQVLGSLMM